MDLISRQAAIDALDKHLRTTDVPVSYPGIVSALTEWLNELPSAQPEPLSDAYTKEVWAWLLDYLTLNPDKDGKECTRIHWLIGVIENAPTIEPEPCKDAVSRAEAIKCITYDEEYMEECLRQLPSVSPKQRTGEWIDDKCSLCGQYVYYGDMRNYCPNCGAKMNGGNQDE